MSISLASLCNSRDNRPPRIIVYGTAGIGKTTFGACAPAPVFIWTEEGAGRLDVAGFPLAKSYGDVMDALAALYTEEHSYRTLVIDSLDWLEPLIWQHLCSKAVPPKANIEDFGYGKGYTYALDLWRNLFDACNALRNTKGMTVIFIAHFKVKRFDSPEVEPYERYEIKLHEKATGLAIENTDVVGFANYRVMTTSSDVGFNKKIVRGVGTGERLMHLVERPAYFAKNRYGMPESIPLSWEAFASHVPSLSASSNPNPNPQPATTEA